MVNRALPIQNDYFVPAAELRQAKDEIQKRDTIIEKQGKQINLLQETVLKCAVFIKDKSHQAFDLMNTVLSKNKIGDH